MQPAIARPSWALLFALSVTACLLPVAVSLTSAAIPLVEDGIPRAEVIVGADAPAVEQAAVDELVRYLQKATGVELPVRSVRSGARPAVLVGLSVSPEAIRRRVLRLDGEGYVVDARGDTVVLAGNGREGTLFAVYEFLERVAGIRWLWPGAVGEVVPRHRSLSMADAEIVKEPAFLWRWFGPGGALWGPHDKWTKERDLNISTAHQAAMKLWERRNRLWGERIFGGHAFGDILPPEVWGPKHPEFYALVNGKRDWENFNGKHRAQLCTTNPEVVRRTVAYCRTLLDANPDWDGVSISANDGRGFCECENCRALDTGRMLKERIDPVQPGRPPMPIISDRMVTFGNQVAAAVALSHPGKKLLFYAYGFYKEPPERVKAHPNLLLTYTVNSATFWHLPSRERAFADLAGWAQVAPTFGVYEYLTQTVVPDMPRLVPDLLQLELKELQRLGSRYFHTQAGNGFAVNGLNFYVLARLLWDPSEDVKAIQADYVEKAFGAAAPAMNRYYERFIASWREQRSELVRMLSFATYGEMIRAYPRALREAARRDLEEALKLVDAEHRARVDFAHDGFVYFEKTMEATEALYPFVKAGWKVGESVPTGMDPVQLERAIDLWRDRDAYVEKHREDFVLSYLWVRANMENLFDPLKRVRGGGVEP